MNYSDGSIHAPEWLGNLLTGIGIVVGTALFGASDAIEAFSGDIKPIIMDVNQTAHNITSDIFNAL